jgi:hypothetical protein
MFILRVLFRLVVAMAAPPEYLTLPMEVATTMPEEVLAVEGGG